MPNFYSELNGRLGNQMFVYAFCRAMSIELNCTPVLYDGLLKCSGIDMRLGCFKLSESLKYASTWNASGLHRFGLVINSFLAGNRPRSQKCQIQRYLSLFFQICGLFLCNEGFIKPRKWLLRNRNVFSIGYFQSEQFFEKHKDEIIRDFSFIEDIKDKCQEWSSKILACTHSVCLHVRLGDYLKFKEFYVCSPNYYQIAIAEMLRLLPDATFFIFTDSPELVIDMVDLPNAIFIPSCFSDQESLYLGSLCRHHIISNSSFSWWMQYLAHSDGQIVFAPSRWMNDGDYTAIYQRHWRLIKV